MRINPRFVPAEPRNLRVRLNAVAPAATGLGSGSWNNVRSLTLAAIRQAGVRAMPGSTRQPLAFPWEALRAHLVDRHLRYGLSRFMSFCSGQGITPDAVNQAVFDRYLHALDSESLRGDPKQCHKTACATWNEAAKTIPGWPQALVVVPDATRRYAYDWDAFPSSLLSEVERYLAHLNSEDPFADDYVESLRPTTIDARRQQIRQIASALARSGYPVEQITGLTVLVKPEKVELALRFFWDRAGKKKTEWLYHQAVLLRNIARHWVKPAENELKAVENLCRRFATKKNGLTEKNRGLLRQFDDQANVDALLTLPARVLQRVKAKDKGGHRDAAQVALALGVELLIVAPMRIKNLTFLEHERHLVPTRLGPTAVLHLIIPGEEVKNGQPYELALPKDSAEFLALYLKDYQPRMSPKATPWLFPGYGGKHRHPEAFSRQISEFVLRETGIRMHAHLFRQLAAKLYLEAHPEDLETVRRFLGHTSQRTTSRSYADIRTAAAFRRYDDMIASRRAQALTRLPGMGRQGGGV
jgi:integrase